LPLVGQRAASRPCNIIDLLAAYVKTLPQKHVLTGFALLTRMPVYPDIIYSEVLKDQKHEKR